MAEDLDLHRLAPAVDADRARTAFAHRRRRARATHRAALTAATVAVAAVGVLAVAVNRDPGGPVVTSPGDSPGAAGDPTPSLCTDIEAFAARLSDTGITYDYEPSASPAQLMATADVVFAGSLTGQTATVDGDDRTGESPAVGYEVAIDRAYKDPPQEDLAGGVRYAWLPVAHASRFDELRRVGRRGVPVVVFGFASGRAPGYLVAVEGLATGCDDGPLLGLVGTEGEWKTVASVQDLSTRLARAVDGGTPSSQPTGADERAAAAFVAAWREGHGDAMRTVAPAEQVDRALAFGTATGEPRCTTQANGQHQCVVATSSGKDAYLLVGEPGARSGEVWWVAEHHDES